MKEKKKVSLPHVYVLLFIIMIAVLLITYLVPSGEYQRIIDPNSGREIVDPATYNTIDKIYLTPMDFFTALHTGFTQTSDIIGMVIAIGGALAVIEKTGAISAGIYAMVKKLKHLDQVLLTIFMFLFSFLGANGFAEGGSVFIPLAVTLSVALGYDRMVGAGAGILGLCVGFTSGFVNTYTVGVGQAILALPLFSGIEFRFVVWLLLTICAVVYVLHYAAKIKKNPALSIYGECYLEEQKNSEDEGSQIPLTTSRILILIVFIGVLLSQVYGTLKLGWYLPQLASLFLMLTVAAGVFARMSPSDVAVEFAKGASNILPACLSISMARSILVLMNQSKIIDTVIHSLSEMLIGKNPIIIVIMVYCIVVLFNFFVTSGSGKAVILMPILGPLGQLTSINQQVMVVIYQMGDGFTNYFWPTSGTLMASLALGNVKYEDWFKFAYKFFAFLLIVGGVVCVAAQLIGLGPF